MTDSSIKPNMFPHLLTLGELKTIICQKFEDVPNLKRLTLEEALDIYRKMILPLPQRENPRTCRGRRLRDKQKLTRTRTTIDGPSLPAKRDRLKSPPEQNVSTKRIRLPSSSSACATSHKLVVKSRKESLEGHLEDSVQKSPGNETKPKRTKITWP